MDAIKAVSDMRRKTPTTVAVDMRGGEVAYATLWDVTGKFT